MKMRFFAPLTRGEASGFFASGGFCFLLLLFSLEAIAQHDPLRPSASFEQEPKTAPLVNAENNDRKRVRSYAMQPPTIPHKTDNYQVDKNANKCMTCHARTRAGETQATPISITHYQDRDGNFLADVSPRRYFCDQCHVVQMQTEPAVKNRFEDVDAIIKKSAKKK